MSNDANQSGAGDDAHPNHFLREWREYMGWSQEELAAMVAVDQSKIHRVERGKRDIKMGFLRDLARVFQVPASALLEVNPATEAGARTASMLLAWNKLTDAQQRDALRMIRALGESDNGASSA